MAEELLPSCVKRNILFSRLPQGVPAKLLSVIRLVHYEVGDVVVLQDRTSPGMFCLYSGKLLSSRETDGHLDDGDAEEEKEDAALQSATLQPPASFGEAAALGIDSTSPITVRALTFSEVYILPQDCFLEAFFSLPEALELMRADVATARASAGSGGGAGGNSPPQRMSTEVEPKSGLAPRKLSANLAKVAVSDCEFDDA